MFSDSFIEFGHDPFFDFGASPFGQRRHSHSHLLAERERPTRRHRRHHHDEPGRPQQQQQLHRSERALVPHRRLRGHPGEDAALSELPGFTFGSLQFDRLFDGVNRMMADVGGRLREAQEASNREDFDGHMYCHSAVYAYSTSDGADEPRVYQAVSETRAGPGGVRETRKALKDSRTREEKVAVGHHIGGRGHTVERRRNARTGEQQEDHHYVGIDEREGGQFDCEWDARAARIADGYGGRGWDRQGRQHRLDERARERRAITDGRH